MMQASEGCEEAPQWEDGAWPGRGSEEGPLHVEGGEVTPPKGVSEAAGVGVLILLPRP